jgi:hypothetical protein
MAGIELHVISVKVQSYVMKIDDINDFLDVWYEADGAMDGAVRKTDIEGVSS